jgi:hypothetical protein
MLTYKSLLESRSNFRNGKCRGYEWTPVKMPNTPLAQYSKGVPETVSKIISLALVLELPVGEWIGQATKSELPIDPVARELLLSNIIDETTHYNAFNHLANDYVIDEYNDATHIFDKWNTDDYHPITKACYAEVGVFLVSLTVLRLFGGESISMVAANVSKDEMRHVATNRGVLTDIGHDFKAVNKIDTLVNETLDWMLCDLTVPGLNKDFFMEQSRLLVTDGYAPELNELTNAADDISPFEHENRLLY